MRDLVEVMVEKVSNWNFKRKLRKVPKNEMKSYKRELSKITDTPLSEVSPEYHFRAAQLYVFTGDKKSGIEAYRSLTDREDVPDEIKAEAYAKIGYLEGDAESLRKAIELNKKDEYVYNLESMELDKKFI